METWWQLKLDYHRSKCYTSYINPRNIATIQAQSKMDSQHDKALKIIIDEITPDINDNQVFQLSSITSRFQELLSEVKVELEDAQCYTSQKLKAKLSSNCLFYPLFLSLDILIWFVRVT